MNQEQKENLKILGVIIAGVLIALAICSLTAYYNIKISK